MKMALSTEGYARAIAERSGGLASYDDERQEWTVEAERFIIDFALCARYAAMERLPESERTILAFKGKKIPGARIERIGETVIVTPAAKHANSFIGVRWSRTLTDLLKAEARARNISLQQLIIMALDYYLTTFRFATEEERTRTNAKYDDMFKGAGAPLKDGVIDERRYISAHPQPSTTAPPPVVTTEEQSLGIASRKGKRVH